MPDQNAPVGKSAPTEGSTTRENVTSDVSEQAETEPVETVTFTLDGREGHRTQRRDADRRGRAARDLHPPFAITLG